MPNYYVSFEITKSKFGFHLLKVSLMSLQIHKCALRANFKFMTICFIKSWRFVIRYLNFKLHFFYIVTFDTSFDQKIDFENLKHTHKI